MKIKRVVMFHKGGTKGLTARVTIPPEFLYIMGITKEDREVEMTIEDGKIIIEKINKKEE